MEPLVKQTVQLTYAIASLVLPEIIARRLLLQKITHAPLIHALTEESAPRTQEVYSRVNVLQVIRELFVNIKLAVRLSHVKTEQRALINLEVLIIACVPQVFTEKIVSMICLLNCAVLETRIAKSVLNGVASVVSLIRITRLHGLCTVLLHAQFALKILVLIRRPTVSYGKRWDSVQE